MSTLQRRRQEPVPVQPDSRRAAETMRDVDQMAEYAIASHALLNGWVATFAGADPVLYDDLRFYVQVSKQAKARVILGYMEGRL